MITIERFGEEFKIKFTGTKKQFTEYINKVMKINHKRWDMEERAWYIKADELDFLKVLFKNITLLNEVVQKDKKQTVNYNDIGKSMKLKPFEYQKEAIKYCIDNEQALLVLPCGAGKKKSFIM